MCGIVGQLRTDGAPTDSSLVRSMCAALRHRGPDEEGFLFQGALGLGMSRLRVLDLEGGRQPMGNEDGSVQVVFNGEIYNHQALRRKLIARGHQLTTRSDTEVIAHLYEDEGLGCFSFLEGMFAIAIWDARQEELILARDRLGKKPLFYAQTSHGFSFSSELTSLLCDTSIDRSINYKAIDEYLSYLFVPHPLSIYANVTKMPPATWIVIDEKSLFRTGSFWNVQLRSANESYSTEDATEELDVLLRSAVNKRLEADVPIGAFLSGGLDSSLIVAVMRSLGHEELRTFSVGFKESKFNELSHAATIARIFETKHEEQVVDYDVEGLIPKLLHFFGEPFADSSAIPTYHLAEVTQNNVTVALSGDGGDEIFGGYRRYSGRLLTDFYNRIPRWAGPGVAEWLLQRFREPEGYYGTNWRKAGRRFFEYASAVRENPRTSWGFFLPKKRKMPFIRIFFRRCCNAVAVIQATIYTGNLHKMLAIKCFLQLIARRI
ncbi:MAG: asparagine synthase (glutamine-hydrolyzing) [Candidatus Latescibacterota bacterium]|nr:asparagine synthase (glutamine-hydrolyzing) [Candidatus Latescibacterota bacterium]